MTSQALQMNIFDYTEDKSTSSQGFPTQAFSIAGIAEV